MELLRVKRDFLQTARRLAIVEVDLERCDSKTEVAEA